VSLEVVGESLESAQRALLEEFAGVFAAETIQGCLADSHERLLPARVQGYVPLLAYRFTRERLMAASRGASSAADRPPLVLFVCTANSGRSQMAAAILEHGAGGAVQVASAGTRPGGMVQPEVAQVLSEIGIGTHGLYPKPLTDEVVGAADVVVTMGCGDTCPVMPGRRYLDWQVADPAGADLEAVRSIRDDVATHVRDLLAELTER
jgi:protein-tyrosine-phosphatase